MNFNYIKISYLLTGLIYFSFFTDIPFQFSDFLFQYSLVISLILFPVLSGISLYLAWKSNASRMQKYSVYVLAGIPLLAILALVIATFVIGPEFWS